MLLLTYNSVRDTVGAPQVLVGLDPYDKAAADPYRSLPLSFLISAYQSSHLISTNLRRILCYTVSLLSIVIKTRCPGCLGIST